VHQPLHLDIMAPLGRATVMRRVVSLALLALAGCTPLQGPPPQLSFDLPPGFPVLLDGVSVNAQAPFDTTPGEHAVTLLTPCGVLEQKIVVAAQGATKVSHASFVGTPWALLKVQTEAPEGMEISPVLTLAPRPAVPTSQALSISSGFEAGIWVPACAVRMTVSPGNPELGALLEDLDLAGAQTVDRKILFPKGSDMVRIAGGPFRLGPPGPDLYDPTFDPNDMNEDSDFEGWKWFQQFDVQIADFEIDRTEVTTAQYLSCRQAGGCPYVPEKALWTLVSGIVDRCTTRPSDPERPPKAGSETKPMNCVGPWEAQDYCSWVGKRLPLDTEWEYAARSRNVRYACSWEGSDHEHVYRLGCSRVPIGTSEIQAPCSVPDDETEQGVCDMPGNVEELVTLATVTERELKGCKGDVWRKGGTWNTASAPPFAAPVCSYALQDSSVGFRCARGTAEPR